MAKVTITIEDTPNGMVSVKAEPTFETMAKANMSGNGLTSAQGYAVSALLHVRLAAKKQKSSLGLTFPRVRKPYQ